MWLTGQYVERPYAGLCGVVGDDVIYDDNRDLELHCSLCVGVFASWIFRDCCGRGLVVATAPGTVDYPRLGTPPQDYFSVTAK
jgi:hypothetical protein